MVMGGGRSYATAAITDLKGKAVLPTAPLPIGQYSVKAYYLSPLDGAGTPLPISLGNGQQ